MYDFAFISELLSIEICISPTSFMYYENCTHIIERVDVEKPLKFIIIKKTMRRREGRNKWNVGTKKWDRNTRTISNEMHDKEKCEIFFFSIYFISFFFSLANRVSRKKKTNLLDIAYTEIFSQAPLDKRYEKSTMTRRKKRRRFIVCDWVFRNILLLFKK